MEQKINPNLLFLTGIIFLMIAIMIGCEVKFHDGQFFTLFVGFINLLIGILIGAFKSIFHIPDNPSQPPITSQVTTKTTVRDAATDPSSDSTSHA